METESLAGFDLLALRLITNNISSKSERTLRKEVFILILHRFWIQIIASERFGIDHESNPLQVLDLVSTETFGFGQMTSKMPLGQQIYNMMSNMTSDLTSNMTKPRISSCIYW